MMNRLTLSLLLCAVACAETRRTHGTLVTFDTGSAIFTPDPVPVTTQPTTKPADPPPVTTQPIPATPANCTRTITPAMGWAQWQSIMDTALPGDTICADDGAYWAPGSGQNEQVCIGVHVSGQPGKPVTLRNVPGTKPKFYGHAKDATPTTPFYGFTRAIRLGWIKYDGTQFGVHDVVIDGIAGTQSPWDGLEIAHSSNIVVRNCSFYANNFNSPNGYKAGINIDAGHDITIDHCRVFDNGFGINAYEDQVNGEGPSPDGPERVTISDCFVFGNSRTGNPGNSSGVDIRFATRCTYIGNVVYDNPDAGFNGEGNNFCRVLNNICINNWQPGGNNEGIKLCVRGGGCNVIAGNLSVGNGNCGYDAAGGVGDLVYGNTFYGNGSWGILAEGRETMMFNNLVAGNSVAKNDNAYPELDATGWSLISDWNVFGRGPLKSTANDTLAKLPPHTRIQALTLAGITLPRTEARQVNTPEMLWGVSTIEEARAIILAKYRPASPISGTSLLDVQSRCNANIPKVISALDAAISVAALSPDFQMKQARHRYELLKAGLTSYGLSGLPDNGAIGAVK